MQLIKLPLICVVITLFNVLVLLLLIILIISFHFFPVSTFVTQPPSLIQSWSVPLQHWVFIIFQTHILVNSILESSFYVSENNYCSLKEHVLKFRASHLAKAVPPSKLILVGYTEEKGKWWLDV